MAGPPPRRAWFIALSLTIAATMALATYAVSRYALDLDLSLIPTVTTALVVGTFFALILLRPRHGEFKVEGQDPEEK